MLCFRFCVSTFEASPSESEISLSEGCAGTCVSRSSRFSVKGCNQSGLALDPLRPSRFLCALNHGLFASVSRMHASVDASDSPEDFD